MTLVSANAHTDEEIAALIDGDKYPGALDTIKEISAAIEDNAETIEILNNAITTKANKDTVGELTDYWQYVENTDSVITAINQNADWVLRNFEQLINKT